MKRTGDNLNVNKDKVYKAHFGANHSELLRETLLTTIKSFSIHFLSILQVPDTGTSQYRRILEHFWCTSIA